MYFDPRPKTRKKDLFNRESELEQFQTGLSYASIIVVTGLRRTGKTSLVDVALSETDHPSIFLDMRDLPVVPSRTEIVRKIETSFNKLGRKWLSTLSSTLSRVKGVSLVGGSINFDWSRKGIDLVELFDNIDSWAKNHNKRFLLAFDEIQLIRGDKNISRLFARTADKDQNIVLILTGSEIGLLHDFLGFDNPKSPLYGRHYIEIKMHNFSPQETKTFLKEGFKQISLSCKSGVLDYATQKLDGVAGWLTLFGARCRDAQKCSNQIVDDVLDDGGKLARAEALEIVKFSPRYGVILNFLSTTKKANWAKIKAVTEVHEKRSLPSSTFTALLRKLVKTSLIEKENNAYHIADTLLAYGIAKEPFKEQFANSRPSSTC